MYNSHLIARPWERPHDKYPAYYRYQLDRKHLASVISIQQDKHHVGMYWLPNKDFSNAIEEKIRFELILSLEQMKAIIDRHLLDVGYKLLGERESLLL